MRIFVCSSLWTGPKIICSVWMSKVCSYTSRSTPSIRPDLDPLVPSTQIPPQLLHLYYHQVVEFFHAVLPLGWTSSPRIWTSVMSVVTVVTSRHGIQCFRQILQCASCNTSPSGHAHVVLCRRSVDLLLLLRGSIKDTSHNRGNTPLRGHCSCVTQGLIRYSDPDPVRPLGIHHLPHWQRTLLIKKKAHRGCPLNEEADIRAEMGRMKQEQEKTWNTPTNRTI